MNPMNIMKMKNLLDRFKKNHPKVPMFFSAAGQNIDVDSVIEIKVTTIDGKELCTNMKVTKEDMDLVRQLKEFEM